MEAEKWEVSPQRLRDYRIYRESLKTAFTSDGANNLDHKVTDDEQSILNMLAMQLGLSQEEVKLIKYQILPVKKQAIDDVINELKTLGVIFFSKIYRFTSASQSSTIADTSGASRRRKTSNSSSSNVAFCIFKASQSLRAAAMPPVS